MCQVMGYTSTRFERTPFRSDKFSCKNYNNIIKLVALLNSKVSLDFLLISNHLRVHNLSIDLFLNVNG